MRQGGTIRLLDRATLDPLAQVSAADADAIAVSPAWLVYRARSAKGIDFIKFRSIADLDAIGPGGPWSGLVPRGS